MTALGLVENYGLAQAEGMLGHSPYWDYIELDPIRIQIQVDRIDAATLRWHLAQQTAQMELARGGGHKVYLIIESRERVRAPLDVRRIQAQWVERNRRLIADCCLGLGFVIENRLVRGGLTAIFWVARPPVPYQVHGTLCEALDYASAFCRKRGVALSAEVDGLDAVARIDSAFERAMSRRIAL